MIKVAVAKGDGIGSEIMAACLKIMAAARVPIDFIPVQMGHSVYLQGNSTGMTSYSRSIVEELGCLYKGPMQTPKGTGVKSINVTARKVWSTFANKRVFRDIPGVNTLFARASIPINLTLIRENIEDTYGGIEHLQSNDVAQCRRLITRPGCLQVHRYAFQAASSKNASRVTCAHKANIMKITDGLFLDTFYQVAKEFPHLKADDVIVDDLAMKLVSRPDSFDFIVLPNLQGDIISDLCAGLVGGLGMAPSANIGDQISIFEAVHGTAPDIEGKNIANPTALLMSGLMMLRHLNIRDKAELIETGLFNTLKKGLRTVDLADSSSKALSTTEFADAIIQNLPSQPVSVSVSANTTTTNDKIQNDNEKNKKKAEIGVPRKGPKPKVNLMMTSPNRKFKDEKVVGMDVFLDTSLSPQDLATHLQSSIPTSPNSPKLKLVMLSNRGTQVWPTGSLFTECINHYRARFEGTENVETKDLLEFAKGFDKGDAENGRIVRLCSFETLLCIDGKQGYSLAQGQ